MNTRVTDLRESLDEWLYRLCTKIELCGMEDCEEGFDPAEARGFHAVTWGIIFHFADGTPLVLTWEISASHGDPHCIDTLPLEKLLEIPSIERFDVTAVEPWSQFVGQRLRGFDVLTYRTNRQGPNVISAEAAPFHNVEWGVEIDFGRPLLVGALYRDYIFSFYPCGDEVVLVYEEGVIERVKAVYDGAVDRVVRYSSGSDPE